ncbi:MAG: homoserine dehydrogenase [Cyclobacteriaceae bacterium]|nr:homoserine dehydrogenase [Cyclobacteriaceae bacterium]
MKKKLTLGLVGFGCVGQGLYRVLTETQGLETEIRKICIKHPEKSRSLPTAYFTTQREELLGDPEIDVIVELIDDADTAWEIVQQALQRGKAVVTANKKMVATHLDELRVLETKYGRPVLYEGAVCGSIPIIRNLEEYYDNDRINRLEGIVNGSTNYILTKVSEEGKSYAEALGEAQVNGFAESDPTLDVEGYDPTFKLSILLTHAFGLRVRPEELIRVGIHRLSAADLSFAKANHLRIRLVAGAYRHGDKLIALVAPRFVPDTHALYSVRNEFNAVSVEGLFAEEQLFVGKGAGGNPTGSAVLSDISALRYDYRYEYRKTTQESRPEYSLDATVEVVVSCAPSVRISPEDFVRFKGGERNRETHRLQGEVTLSTLADWSRRDDISIILAPGAIPKPVEVPKQEELAAA